MMAETTVQRQHVTERACAIRQQHATAHTSWMLQCVNRNDLPRHAAMTAKQPRADVMDWEYWSDHPWELTVKQQGYD